MLLQDEIGLADACKKPRELEERYEVHLRRAHKDVHVHELTGQSLKRFISQLKEDIARYEVRQRERHHV